MFHSPILVILVIVNLLTPSIIISHTILGETSGEETEYYALIVACSKYNDTRNNIPPIHPIPEILLKPLYYSLLQADNWKKENIILLLNENATRTRIINALLEMSQRVDSNDIFLFSWAGHGSIIHDVDGDEKENNPGDKYDEVICPYDTTVINGTLTNVLTDDELDYYFSKIDAKGMCLIFECCFSGGLTSKFNYTTTCIDTIPSTLDVDGENRVIITSTPPNHIGYICGYEFGLTNSFAKTLRNNSHDTNKDGFISAEEAFRYAKRRYHTESALFLMSLLLRKMLLKLLLKTLLKRMLNRFIDSWITFQLNLRDILRWYLFLIRHYPINYASIQDNYPGELPLIKVR